MTKKEQIRMLKLEKENAYLRERLDKSMKIYIDQLYELCDLKTMIETIREVLGVTE